MITVMGLTVGFVFLAPYFPTIFSHRIFTPYFCSKYMTAPLSARAPTGGIPQTRCRIARVDIF